MFRRRKGQTYRELVVDELEDRKKKKKRVRRCCCLGCMLFAFLLLVVIICTVVIVLVSLKIECTGSKVIETVKDSRPIKGMKVIDVYATGDIRFITIPQGEYITVNYSQFSMTRGKQKKKTRELYVGNDTISIKAKEPYGVHGMGWYMGDLCSGTDIIIGIPDPTGRKRDALSISVKSVYGSVYFDYSFEVQDLIMQAYQEIVVDSANILSHFTGTTVLKDILVENLNISEVGKVELKNRFGDIKLNGMRTRFSNISWPKLHIETKYGDVTVDDSDRADTEIESTFTGDVTIAFFEHNLGPETIGFNMSTDNLSLKDIKVDSNHAESTHHTVAFQGQWKYGGQRKVVGTISKVSNLPIHHHLNIQGTYSGINLKVHD